ncbi:penicillin acylase family protein [Flavihumibacter stibioxidans]|uniref:Penicillin amidase n=1 Tax=Flavihumibacter stibioxidans TaxID=1834163 RepID=A0ABR7M677_9BACT|nr:penicillin acylase family protein [Flavihumibacter stibioxidans]MBC6490528.1 penicillin amidase [Flavihumibacter stibioxidans]
MRIIFLLLLLPVQLLAQRFTSAEISRWEKQSTQVKIIRDNMGIPHIYGKSDADAVFGLMYAQCEDDFSRVERNYIEKLGRMAEIKGKDALYEDLLIRLVIDSSDAIRDYQRAPAWLKKLCNAFADGINFYLSRHPEKKPALLARFQPWYPLLWTDGSIGAISTADITMTELKEFYCCAAPLAKNVSQPAAFEEPLPTGSNGFAFAPSITESGNAILYINPHVTFYFRPEVHMVSEEGLNAYGAVTWGQFFIYQGFNERCGWMHTSSYVDAADSYIEKIRINGDKWTYQYDGRDLPVKSKPVQLKYISDKGVESTTIQARYTHHGPVMAQRNGQYLSMKADNRLMEGLVQCWQRTKARDLKSFEKTLDLKGNISNNTVYADAAGNIAYWHGNRVPHRDPKIDWSKPVDGSTSATEWKGLHPISKTLHVINPSNGWLQNCNSTPFRVAGDNSPAPSGFPAYMAPDGENFRGINAVRVLQSGKSYNLDKVISAGYDSRLAAFEILVPALVDAFEKNIPPSDSLFAWLAGPVAVLKNWDYRSSESSVATTLAVEWGQKLLPLILRTKAIDDEELDQVEKTKQFVKTANPESILQPLVQTVRELQGKYGRWQLPWGEINRIQRISPAIDMQFDDNRPSYPVGFASGTWGMLPSYNSRTFTGTSKRYGVHGNSFVCAVEFGKRVKAKALLAGGQSGDPASSHFDDQVEAYSKGKFRDVLFYKEDVMKHIEREYHPGQ